jgi:hypothetical protein
MGRAPTGSKSEGVFGDAVDAWGEPWMKVALQATVVVLVSSVMLLTHGESPVVDDDRSAGLGVFGDAVDAWGEPEAELRKVVRECLR